MYGGAARGAHAGAAAAVEALRPQAPGSSASVPSAAGRCTSLCPGLRRRPASSAPDFHCLRLHLCGMPAQPVGTGRLRPLYFRPTHRPRARLRPFRPHPVAVPASARGLGGVPPPLRPTSPDCACTSDELPAQSGEAGRLWAGLENKIFRH